jgi:AcrR family transcriptional regulator
MVGEPTARRPRRSSAEVRDLILTAAQELFAANGFRGTSTREIADRAGVAEVLLFRNFGTKSELYSAAVVAPLTQFFDSWLSMDWSKWDRKDTEQRQREFIAQLYGIVAKNRGLIMSYLAMTVFEPELVTGLEHTPALLDALDRTADATGEHLGRLGKAAGSNTRVGTRAVVGMILAMALFHDFGSPTGKQPTRDEVIDEMTQIVLHGGLHRTQPRSVRAVRVTKAGSAAPRRATSAAATPRPASRRRATG